MSHAKDDETAYNVDPPWERRRHREMLIVCLTVVIAAFLLDVGAEERVYVRGCSTAYLPPLCGSRDLFGVDCPGCGLTRSIVYLAHGKYRNSFEMHRLGWLFAVAILLQFPYRIVCLLRPNKNPVSLPLRRATANVLIIALVLNWVLQLAAG